MPITYNAMGEVVTHGQKQLFWDPWGKLVKITDHTYAWEASYDALGRRLQTRFSQPGTPTNVTTSFYDPDEEFREIGLCINGATFWKLYGPDVCDAISDEAGNNVTLMHNALRQLNSVICAEGTFHNTNLPSAYGPLQASPIPTDLFTYAHSLTWHSKAPDPTGFMWLGDRYLDCHSGKFLSQDPISYPNCLDLYAYAGGDPINYHDLDGRFASYAYGSIKSTFLSAWENPSFQYSLQALKGAVNAGESVGSYLWNSPRFHGALRACGASFEIWGGAQLTLVCPPLGLAVATHGADQLFAGGSTMMTGANSTSATERIIQGASLSPEMAALVNDAVGIFFDKKVACVALYKGGLALSSCLMGVARTSKVCKALGVKKYGVFTKNNYRHNLEVFTGLNPPGSQGTGNQNKFLNFKVFRCNMTVIILRRLRWQHEKAKYQNM